MASNLMYRADHVGSLLRPAALEHARREHAARRIDAEALREAEDAAIREAIALQEAAGLSVVSDGELRRSDFRSVLGDAVEGLSETTQHLTWHGAQGERQMPSKTWVVCAKLRARGRLCGHEAAFLVSNASMPVKICLPAPGFMAATQPRTGAASAAGSPYPDPAQLRADMAHIVRAEIQALIDQGVSYIQLDNPRYTFFSDPGARARLAAMGADPERGLEEMLACDRAALEGLRGREDVTIGVHLCRGNFSGHWLSRGSYDPVAEKLFAGLPVDRFLLEYDDERAGDFSALRYLPKGKAAVLGLISSKTPVLETPESVLRRMDEAAKHVDGDFLALSPQCGFSSTADAPNPLTPEDQRHKLELVADVARMYWGFEI